ncbi:MAG: GTP-binding protein [Bacteroidota bacterium]
MEDYRIPVTILTGFLGSGKTTLLNRFIKEYPDKKFAIIENEFGEINIDSNLVVGVEGDNIFEMSNGCICCTLNDDLYKVLDKLLNSEKPFNHLIIESTGIADPTSIIHPFIVDYEIQLQFRLDSLICLVDSEFILDIIETEQEALKQIALADVIILNKKGNVSPEFFIEVKNEVSAINCIAEIIETDFADIKGNDILNKQVLTPQNINEFFKKVFSTDSSSKPNPIHAKSMHAHSFIIKGEMDYERFSLWMDYFLTFNQNSIYRIKGIFYFADVACKMIAQSVKTSFLMMEGEAWKNDDQKESKVVFIGKYLDAEVIEENLMSFVIR